MTTVLLTCDLAAFPGLLLSDVGGTRLERPCTAHALCEVAAAPTLNGPQAPKRGKGGGWAAASGPAHGREWGQTCRPAASRPLPVTAGVGRDT